MSPKAIKVGTDKVAADLRTARRYTPSVQAKSATVVTSDVTTTTTDKDGHTSKVRTITRLPRAVFRLFVEEEVATIVLKIVLSALASGAGYIGWEWLHHFLAG